MMSSNNKLSKVKKLQNVLGLILIDVNIYLLNHFIDWTNGLQMTGLHKIYAGSPFDSLDPENPLGSKGICNRATTNSTFSSKFDLQPTWGILTAGITFIPGLVFCLSTFISFMFGAKSFFAYQSTRRTPPTASEMVFKSIGLLFFFPAYLMLLVFRCCVNQLESQFTDLLTVMTMGTILTAGPQMLLQLHIILSGRCPTNLQIFSLVISSFLTLRASINLHNGTGKFYKGNFCLPTLKVLPLFASCVLFRIGSILILMIHFRWWALIPFLITAVTVGLMAKKNGYSKGFAIIIGLINTLVMVSAIGPSKQQIEKFYRNTTFAIFGIYSSFLVGFGAFWICLKLDKVPDSVIDLIYFKNKALSHPTIEQFGPVAAVGAVLLFGIINLVLLLFKTMTIGKSLRSESNVAETPTSLGRCQIQMKNRMSADSFECEENDNKDYDNVEERDNRNYDNVEEELASSTFGEIDGEKIQKDGYDYGFSSNESDDEIPDDGYLHPSQIGPRLKNTKI